MAHIVAEPDYMRGTGRTTKQMQDAPRGAFFMFGGNRTYYRDLARKLDREDLKLLDGLDGGYWRFYVGQYNHKIIVDHCLALEPNEANMIAIHNSRVEEQKNGL